MPSPEPRRPGPLKKPIGYKTIAALVKNYPKIGEKSRYLGQKGHELAAWSVSSKVIDGPLTASASDQLQKRSRRIMDVIVSLNLAIFYV